MENLEFKGQKTQSRIVLNIFIGADQCTADKIEFKPRTRTRIQTESAPVKGRTIIVQNPYKIFEIS